MYSNILESISGIEFFGLVSLLIFFTIFILVLFWTIKIDKNYINKMKEMPQDSSKLNGDIDHG